MDDQALFAAWSGDRNPMHVDPVSARRLLTGLPVVHGIHVLLTALEHWVHDSDVAASVLDCTFNNAINVGDEVVFQQKNDDDHVVIEAQVAGLCCARVRMTAGATPGDLAAPVATTSLEESLRDRLDTPMDLPPEQQAQQRYVLGVPPTEELRAHFPRTCKQLAAERVSGLLALSYFVGMVCPGLHSIFATVSLRLGDPLTDAAAIALTVDSYDPRFRRFQVSITGALSGNLAAFLRSPPQRQQAMDEISRAVATDEFKATRSLVIGASRGLGELVAKVLAAGGGDVVIGYARGRDDAEKVAAEISAWGRGDSEIVQIDVTTDDFDRIDFERLDAVYFFATPRIYRKKKGVFVDSFFQEFVDFYVKGLHALCERIEALPLDRQVRVYVPSSVFVAERPDGLTEYAMAKAAVEVMIDDINRAYKRVRILATRLPRLSTDQTSSLLRIPSDDNLAAVLPVVRAMNEPWTRSWPPHVLEPR